jgi:integrase
MNIKIKKITVNGEQSVFYTDEYGAPFTGNLTIDWASNYLCCEKGGTTIASRETKARHLLFCITYFIDNNIDVVNRVASGQFFEYIELDEFSKHCYMKQKFIKRTLSSSVVSFTQKDSISPSTRQSTFRQQSVANTTARERLRIIRDFLEYLFKRHHSGEHSISLAVKHSTTIKHLKREISKATPQNTKVIDVDEQIFTEKMLKKIFDITQVNHPENPFQRSQLRNRIIIETIFDIGARRGALLNLKIGDIKDADTPRLDIINRVNFDDPRLHRPTQKTQSGAVGTQRSTTQNIKLYIEIVRGAKDPNDTEENKSNKIPLFPKATNHDFIFIAESGETKGQPLSITGFNYIFEVLSKALNVHITPHLIRHHWNYAFTQDCEEAGISNVEIDKLRKSQMTWAIDSKMAEKYNKRAILEKVREVKQGYQSQLFYKEAK